MKTKLPLIRVFIYILLTVVLVGGIHFTVHASISSKKEEVQNSKLALKEKETELENLSKKQQDLSSRLNNLKNQTEEVGEGKKILINKDDLITYLTLQALANEVEINHIDHVNFRHKNDVWEVKYNIGVRGPYENVVDFIDIVSEIGSNYFSENMNILQAGPSKLENPKGSWVNNRQYFTYETKEGEKLENFYYVGGRINFPVVIETAEKPRPFLRLTDIIYSDRTITRYDWQVEEVKLLIGEEEHGLGYPETDFNKQEMKLNVDFELKESMIGSEVKGVKFQWRSLNKEHEVFIPLQRPIVITEEMFSEQPWKGEINEEIAKYNLEMLNSIIYTDFNIVFLMEEVPDVYFDFVVKQIDDLKTQIQNNKISVPNEKTLIVHQEEERKYSIDNNVLFLNGKPLFELNDGHFLLNGQELKVRFNALNNMNYDLTFEEVLLQELVE